MRDITLLFYPEPLKKVPLSRVYRICKEYGINFHNDSKLPYDLHIFWSYTKCRIIPDGFTLNAKDCINKGCWDVGKERVNDIFNDIRIDPTIFKGICVEKLDLQGRHGSHHLIECPAKEREGYIYQKYIENKEGDLFYKYRIYYADGINYILKSYKPNPFGSECVRHELIDKNQLFTIEQEQDFHKKCKEFGFDFGEIDAMVDKGKLIIIDVNNVVGGGFVWGLTGTQLHKDIDYTFIKFLEKRINDKTSEIC